MTAVAERTEVKLVLAEYDATTGRPSRVVTVSGERADVAEAVGLYMLGRDAVRNRMKPKHYGRMVAEAADELYGA